VLFLLSQKTNTFGNLVPRWLNILNGLQGHKKDILVIEEQLTNDIERGVIEDDSLAGIIQKENVIEIFSFCSLSLWWPHVIKFVFNLKSYQPYRRAYMFVNKEQDEKTVRVVKILKEVFQAFGYEEKWGGDLQIKIWFQKEINPSNTNNNFNFDVTSDTSNQTISNELLSILIRLGVIYPERTYCRTSSECIIISLVVSMFAAYVLIYSFAYLIAFIVRQG
jgi:hypothetical protein